MLIRTLAPLLLALYLAFAHPAMVFGQPPPLVLTDAVDLPITGEYIELLRDPSGDLGFGDVSSPGLAGRFEPAGGDIPNLGFTRNTIWARLRVRNEIGSPQALVLKVGDTRLAFVDYWVRTGSRARVLHLQNGRFQDPAKRDLSHRSFLFDLPLGEGDTAEITLRIRSYANLNLPLRITTLAQVNTSARWEYLGLGIFFGALLIMLGYNLVLFGFLREFGHLFLCLVIFFAALWRFDYDGLLTTVPPRIWPVEWPGQMIGAYLGCAFACLFTRAFFGTRRTAAGVDRVLLAIAAVGFMLPLLHWIDPDLAMLLLSVYGLVNCVAVISAALLFWSRGYRLARYFLLAFILLSAAVTVLSLANFGLVPTGALTQAGPYAGLLMMILLLSVAQADRINMLREDAERANLALRQNEARLGEQVNKRTIELIYARDRAEAASRAKSQFLANVSHELRTPMNAVLGFASLLRQQDQRPSSQRYLNAIEGAGRTLLTLIGDILDLSKVESGKLELRTGAVDLRVVAAELRRMFAEPVAEKGLQLFVVVEQAVPDWIAADEVRLRQILVNFVGNAVKYTERGHIDLCISAQREDDGCFQLLFAVADTGSGIPVAVQETVFQPFVQLNLSSEYRAGGVGLGLAICTRLARLMGGEIRLQSELDVGSTFTLVLRSVRIAEPPPLPNRASAPQEFKFESARILITDDDRSNRLLLREYMRPFDFELIEAQTGEQALDLARSAAPDLILMDIGLPETDGIAVTQALKSDPRTAAIPVIAVTAAVVGRRAEEAVRVCDGYLSKPVSKAALVAALAGFLKKDTRLFAAPKDAPASEGTGAVPIGLQGMAIDQGLHKRIVTLRPLKDCQQQIRQFVVREADIRGELATHVHEAPLQDLTLASIQLKLAAEGGTESAISSGLASAAAAVDRANRSLRVLMTDLGSQLLTEIGLDAALESIVVQARARWEIPFEYIREDALDDLPYLTELLLRQSLRHLIRRISGRPGVIAGDLFASQLEKVLEIQVDFELDEDCVSGGTETGWRSVDLHRLRERLLFVGADVSVEIDGAMLRANYRVPTRDGCVVQAGLLSMESQSSR